jgi:hypothetical protein
MTKISSLVHKQSLGDAFWPPTFHAESAIPGLFGYIIDPKGGHLELGDLGAGLLVRRLAGDSYP